MRRFLWEVILAGVLGLVFVSPQITFGASKSKSEPSVIPGKKVIAISKIENIQIEMPDKTIHNFGEDFQASLTTQLMRSGKYIVADTPSAKKITSKSQLRTTAYSWLGSVTPSATLNVKVEALNFSTGSRGDRMFYGFDERFRTPFNDGSNTFYNEFPLRILPGAPSWFGTVFDAKGVGSLDSRSGLDLGDGFEIDFLFAWLSVKYAQYHSELHLTLELDTPVDSAKQSRWIGVSGNGYFFDVSGAYENYSAGISVARKDAMNQALKKALDGSYGAVDRVLDQLPLVARIDAITADGTVLLGTGPNSGVLKGVYFAPVNIDSTQNTPAFAVQVDKTVESGSMSRLVLGDIAQVRPGMVLKQVASLAEVTQQAKNTRKALGLRALRPSALSSESIQLSNENIAQSDLNGLVPSISRWQAWLMSLEEFVFLPYRIYRYFMYDLAYHKAPDGGSSKNVDFSGEAWFSNVGLSQLPSMDGGSPVVVAVIDSGVDYNHPALHDSLWLNPLVQEDVNGRKDRYGWDFISQDSRPADDGYHGTQIASLVVGINPQARIMPIKVFNPWGITTSAAMNAAFTYAVDHGAQIIVCGWATSMYSKAVEQGVAYAKDHGVIVVAAAGDDGMSLDQLPYYPAVYSHDFENVLSVAAVDDKDLLFQKNSNSKGRSANSSAHFVSLAAPGVNIPVAEPRNEWSRDTSSGLSAALVAGALSRYMSGGLNVRDAHEQLLKDADPIPGLAAGVSGGLRLHLRR